MKDTFENSTVFGIEDDGGEKIVHFYGYGYRSDDGTNTPYRFVEYAFCYAPLKEVISLGFEVAEAYYGPEAKQYIEDCTKEEMNAIYEHYDNGNMPTILNGALTMSTPCGVYIY